MEKYSERIERAMKEWRGKNPYFFTDNGYEPDIRQREIIKILDELQESNNQAAEGSPHPNK